MKFLFGLVKVYRDTVDILISISNASTAHMQPFVFTPYKVLNNNKFNNNDDNTANLIRNS